MQRRRNISKFLLVGQTALQINHYNLRNSDFNQKYLFQILKIHDISPMRFTH